VKQLREDLGWTQQQLADAAGVTPETVSNVENRPEGARGERPSVAVLLGALERERQRRVGEKGPKEDRTLMEFLSRSDLEDVRVRRIGPSRKVRYIAAIVPDPDATPEDIQRALEEFHREQRRHDG
jgi:transcriptional regulator with XRE-family HTH domain